MSLTIRNNLMTSAPQERPLLVNTREAARMLCISERTLWTLTQEGRIPSLKIGRAVRYRVADLEAWTQREVAQAPTSPER